MYMTSKLSSKTNTHSRKVLILGSGYIASHLNTTLLSVGHSVKMLDSKSTNYHDERVFWRELNFEFEPDIVINCSGFTGRPNIDEAESKKEECWRLNVTSPLRCAELTAQLGKRYIHIGSGCIYTGYDASYTEEDAPNFGLFDNESSFYSKTKHAFEVMTRHLPITIVRIRMPISSIHDDRSYLSKIRKYNDLIDYKNSKTYIPDLCNFVIELINKQNTLEYKYDIYNVVNPNPLSTSDVVKIMKKHGKDNPNWKFVDIADIPIIAGRSNCILDDSKVKKIIEMRDERDILEEVLND